MFLCEEHHDKDCPMRSLHLRSHGPCEVCRKVTTCYDCHVR